MSRLIRAGIAAGLVAVSLGTTSASACTVTLEERKFGGENWTGTMIVPVVNCG